MTTTALSSLMAKKLTRAQKIAAGGPPPVSRYAQKTEPETHPNDTGLAKSDVTLALYEVGTEPQALITQAFANAFQRNHVRGLGDLSPSRTDRNSPHCILIAEKKDGHWHVTKCVGNIEAGFERGWNETCTMRAPAGIETHYMAYLLKRWSRMAAGAGPGANVHSVKPDAHLVLCYTPTMPVEQPKPSSLTEDAAASL